MSHLDKHYRANFRNLVMFHQQSLGFHGAEDAVQNAYVQAIQFCDTEEKLRLWFTTILKNCIRRHLATERARGVVIENFGTYQRAMDPFERSPEEEHVAASNIGVIEVLIRNHPNEEARMVLECLYLKGMDYQEVADYLGVSYNKARQIVSRFRKVLARSHEELHL